MDELRATWARRVRSLRLERGLTQEKLAERIGVSQVRVSSWEAGLSVPRDEARIALARAFGVRVSDVFPYPDDLDEANGGEGEAA